MAEVIDGARIACLTAHALIELETGLERKAEIADDIRDALDWLDEARSKFPTIITSVHHVARPGVCQVCGCTEENCEQCAEITGEPCHWVNPERTLCSRCALGLMKIGV